MPAIFNGGYGGWCVTQNFESGPTKDHFSSNFWAKDCNCDFFCLRIFIIGINTQGGKINFTKKKKTGRYVELCIAM